MDIFSNLLTNFTNPMLGTKVILQVLLASLLLSIYEFAVYKLVSHRAFYNRAFHICITVLPYFISTIILCLQSNIVITLGTIGALAILRFRTAVKDPVDMLYLLWSVHIGITCGCQLYEVAVLTSLLVTIVLLVLENIHITRQPYILAVHFSKDEEEDLLNLLSQYQKRYKIKSRIFTGDELNMVIELTLKDPKELTDRLSDNQYAKFSLIACDGDDLL